MKTTSISNMERLLKIPLSILPFPWAELIPIGFLRLMKREMKVLFQKKFPSPSRGSAFLLLEFLPLRLKKLQSLLWAARLRYPKMKLIKLLLRQRQCWINLQPYGPHLKQITKYSYNWEDQNELGKQKC